MQQLSSFNSFTPNLIELFDISFKSLPINTYKQQPKKLPILE